MANDWILVRRTEAQPGDWLHAPWNGGFGGQYLRLADSFPLVDWEGFLVDGDDSPDTYVELAELEVDDTTAQLTILSKTQPAHVSVRRDSVEARSHANQSHADQQRCEVAHPEGLSAEQDHRQRWLASLHTSSRKPSSQISLMRISADDVVACWTANGGAEGWVQERRARELAVTKTAELAAVRRHHDDGDHFINPYTFIPLPDRVYRSRPRGHASMAEDGLSGWFDWKLEFTSPLALPQDMQPVTEELLRYPGSALRGALRSLHEVLAHGCLRILDTDYVPVHREPMTAFSPSRYRLAVVESVENGRVRTLRVLTNEPVWIPFDKIPSVPGGLYSGARLAVDPRADARVQGLKRLEVHDEGAVTEGDTWVVHLTDAVPRNRKPTYFVAAACFGPTDEIVEVTDEQWARWQRVTRGSDDMVRDNNRSDTSRTVPGSTNWPGLEVHHTASGLIGLRRKVDGWLAPGDTLWVTNHGRQWKTAELKMAVIWRSEGDVPVRERLPSASGQPDSNEPCHDPENLCPTCAIFGSIAPDSGSDTQAGYGSHTRVGAGYSASVVTSFETEISPLRGPKPSAGGFYLQLPTDTNPKLLTASVDDNHVPRAHWGSQLDRTKTGPRKIRGRKFYWHGFDDRAKLARHRPRAQDPKQLKMVNLVQPPVLCARVHFDNLNAIQLASLLAAADPSRVLSARQPLAIHIGGGKPFGFGSARPAVLDLVVYSARGRYASSPAKPADYDVVAELAQFTAGNTGDDRRQVWGALAHVLEVEAVHADRLWYPTVGNFEALANAVAHGDQQVTKEFDQSFEWFSKNSGAREGDLAPLPDVASLNQYLGPNGGQA